MRGPSVAPIQRRARWSCRLAIAAALGQPLDELRNRGLSALAGVELEAEHPHARGRPVDDRPENRARANRRDNFVGASIESFTTRLCFTAITLLKSP
jgi:hypothetical protein